MEQVKLLSQKVHRGIKRKIKKSEREREREGENEIF